MSNYIHMNIPAKEAKVTGDNSNMYINIEITEANKEAVLDHFDSAEMYEHIGDAEQFLDLMDRSEIIRITGLVEPQF